MPKPLCGTASRNTPWSPSAVTTNLVPLRNASCSRTAFGIVTRPLLVRVSCFEAHHPTVHDPLT